MCMSPSSNSEADRSLLSASYTKEASAAALAGLNSFLTTPGTKRNTLLAVSAVFFLLLAFLYLGGYGKGMHRVVQFWSHVGPWIIEFKWLKFKYSTLQGLPAQEVQKLLHPFHERTAHKAVALVLEIGGIYVKLGQIIAATAAGIVQDEYIRALTPLQEGIPPRSLEEMSQILERSTGKKLHEAFEWMDPKPIGAASIAQAHKAILKKKNPNDPDDVVIVKIQYPEVAELFEADLNNLETVIRLVNPGAKETVRALRERHNKELDFRLEANHLKECRTNMQKHKLEPQLVRIPVVRDDTGLCTSEVLVMEFLEGQSLNSAIEQEQDRMARALGKEDGKALREFIVERIGEHLEQTHVEPGRHHEPNPLERIATSQLGARVFRGYVTFSNGLGRVRDGLGGILLPFHHKSTTKRQQPKQPVHVNMGRVLKTLIRVHGIQMLRDGVYNADPHPGNVLVLPDGRLGLLDYGMVGRVSAPQRRDMAETILALASKDTTAVNAIYKRAGYRASWKEGDLFDQPEIVRRFATSHFDRFDLSPIPLRSPPKKNHDQQWSSGEDDASSQNNPKDKQLLLTVGGSTEEGARKHHQKEHPSRKRSVRLLEVMESAMEWCVPDWIEQGRRLTALMAGISLQVGRPTSMAKEWSSLAREVMEELKDMPERSEAETCGM